MACYYSVLGVMRDKRCCGPKGDASWEECVPEIYTVKCTQKCNNYDKERW